jgi:glycosyltransferase involved in cell wall biosynthesis
MRRILLLLPSLDHGGAARQLGLLATGLPRDRFEVRVGVLGGDGPAGKPVRSAGIPIEVLGWQRLLDPAWLVRLRRLLRDFQPDVVHTWQIASLRALGLVGQGRARLVVSAPWVPRERPERDDLFALDRWLLQRADRVVASGPSQAERYRRLGITAERIAIVAPGVECPADIPLDTPAEPGRPHIVAVGPLEPHKGFLDAVWALDILSYVYTDLHLTLVGTGSHLPRLRRFVNNIPAGDRVHFVGRQDDVSALLAGADLVWVPSRAEAGMNVALEAMALGRPVIATDLPGLAEIVANEETGVLIPRGEPVVLARQTRRLLDDGALRRRLGEAARRRVRESFSVDDMVRKVGQLYEAL